MLLPFRFRAGRVEKGVSVRNHKVSFRTLTSGGGPFAAGHGLRRGFLVSMVCVRLFGLVVRGGSVGW